MTWLLSPVFFLALCDQIRPADISLIQSAPVEVQVIGFDLFCFFSFIWHWMHFSRDTHTHTHTRRPSWERCLSRGFILAGITHKRSAVAELSFSSGLYTALAQTSVTIAHVWPLRSECTNTSASVSEYQSYIQTVCFHSAGLLWCYK